MNLTKGIEYYLSHEVHMYVNFQITNYILFIVKGFYLNFPKIKCQQIVVAFNIIRNRNNVPVVSPLTRCQSLLLGKKRSSYFHLIPTIKSNMEVVYKGQIRQNNFHGIAPTVRQLSRQHSPKLVVYLILKTCIHTGKQNRMVI